MFRIPIAFAVDRASDRVSSHSQSSADVVSLAALPEKQPPFTRRLIRPPASENTTHRAAGQYISYTFQLAPRNLLKERKAVPWGRARGNGVWQAARLL